MQIRPCFRDLTCKSGGGVRHEPLHDVGAQGQERHGPADAGPARGNGGERARHDAPVAVVVHLALPPEGQHHHRNARDPLEFFQSDHQRLTAPFTAVAIFSSFSVEFRRFIFNE